jgi:hypothetical protein
MDIAVSAGCGTADGDAVLAIMKKNCRIGSLFVWDYQPVIQQCFFLIKNQPDQSVFSPSEQAFALLHVAMVCCTLNILQLLIFS